MFGNIQPECPPMQTNTNRPKLSNFLEMKRRMFGIAFQEFELLVRPYLDILRQSSITRPKAGGCVMLHNSLVFPA